MDNVMDILIAEDEKLPRRLLETMLTKRGYRVVVTTDGNEAWEAIQQKEAPQLIILDWMMPGVDGVELCRRIRQKSDELYHYTILLTSKNRKKDVAAGLEAGADDYVVKPFDSDELLARVSVGERMLNLQNELADHVKKLENALSQVEQLEGLLPICAYCKKVRGDKNYWQQVEGYLTIHSKLKFSHSICPECYNEHVSKELEQLDTPDN